jgi:hypothetical protein
VACLASVVSFQNKMSCHGDHSPTLRRGRSLVRSSPIAKPFFERWGLPPELAP